MSDLEKVRVGVGVTKNLGDFNSLRLDFSYECHVGKDETPEDAAARAWKLAEDELERRVAEYED